MGWCSRCVAGALSEAFGGSGRLTWVVVTRSKLEQPASSNATSAGAISRRAADPGPDACVESLTTLPIQLRSGVTIPPYVSLCRTLGTNAGIGDTRIVPRFARDGLLPPRDRPALRSIHEHAAGALPA